MNFFGQPNIKNLTGNKEDWNTWTKSREGRRKIYG